MKTIPFIFLFTGWILISVVLSAHLGEIAGKTKLKIYGGSVYGDAELDREETRLTELFVSCLSGMLMMALWSYVYRWYNKKEMKK